MSAGRGGIAPRAKVEKGVVGVKGALTNRSEGAILKLQKCGIHLTHCALQFLLNSPAREEPKMTTLNPIPTPEPATKPILVYEAPRIVHKAELKQFTGSPLVVDPGADVLGLPQ